MRKARPASPGAGAAVHSGGTVADSHGLPFSAPAGRGKPGLLVNDPEAPAPRNPCSLPGGCIATRASARSARACAAWPVEPAFSLSVEISFVKALASVNNSRSMRAKATLLTLTAVACLLLSLDAREKEKSPPKPTSWGYVATDSVEVRPKTSDRKAGLLRLGRGALLPVFELKQKGTTTWARVRAVDPATLTPRAGWVDASQLEILPLAQSPNDADLLKLLGGAYLDDFTAANTALARFLVREAGGEPALVCFLGSHILPHSRLQVFRRSQGRLVPGPFREFLFQDMQAGISSLEVRDLLGDGNECLITREPFSLGLENRGVNLVIYRIEGPALRILWKAPTEFRNLAAFPPQRQSLEPPERNIGTAGTVTTGTVEFGLRGRVTVPVWKGKVEFFAFGRAEPVETLPIEKVCAWTGTEFAPLR